MPDRLDVQFPSGNVNCHAWLYTPKSEGPAPVIVMGHGLGGVKEMRLDAYAEKFCTAGYACLVFDYRNFGASDGEPRQLLDIDLQLEDWAAAIAYARSRQEVVASQVILWGTSFGGGHVIVAAARDKQVAGVISQCPFTDGIASALVVNPWTSLKIAGLAIRDVLGSWLGKAPVMVALAGPPKSAALMASLDSEPGYLGLVPPDMPFKNYVAARFVLNVFRHRPGRSAVNVQCPILFCLCETDSIAPAKAAVRYASAAPKGEQLVFQEGHFDIYVGAAFEKVVAKQLEFLRCHVPN